MATHAGVFKKPHEEPSGEQTPGGIKLEESNRSQGEDKHSCAALPRVAFEDPRDKAQSFKRCVHHVPLLSQTRGCPDRDHQEGHPRRRLRGQVHRQEVSIWASSAGRPAGVSSTVSPLLLLARPPSGATGVSTATTAGRRSTYSRRWSPPIRRRCSLTCGARTALCRCRSPTARPRPHRRASSKKLLPHQVLSIHPL